MELRRILVLTGDHGRADPTKWDGVYSKEDFKFHGIMVEALQSLGRWKIEVCSEHSRMLARLREDPPDLVFNLCDTGFHNDPRLELHVPALLEVLGLRYTGSPPAALAVAYDKVLVNLLAASMGVSVPRERVVPADATLQISGVAYPAFVKPAQGDGSVGINRGAVVRSEEDLSRQLAWLRRILPGRAALIQEYLPGTEYGLALIGNPGCLRALPVLEVDYGQLPLDLPPILAFETKTGPATPYERVVLKPAHLEPAVVEKMVQDASRLFERIGCRDYARFDFRTAEDGTIRLLEVNPNPGWSQDSKLPIMAAFAGIDYPRFLEVLLEVAWARENRVMSIELLGAV